MKTLIISLNIIAALLLSTAIFAGGNTDNPMIPTHGHTRNTLYVGVQLGFSKTDYTDSDLKGGFKTTFIDNTGIATHLFLGYNINRFFATQFGVIFFSRPQFYGIPTASSRKTIANTLVGVFLKGQYPIKRFNLFLKVGGGYIARGGFKVGPTEILKEGTPLTPMFGGGVEYGITHNWWLIFSVTATPPIESEQLPASYFLGAGMSYNFNIPSFM